MSNFADLEIFSKVVAAGSMSAAGRELGLSPAVVSKRLRRLEDRLGTRLLQRTTRQIALTEAGQGFYERVIAILASVEEAETFVSGRSSEARGTLKVTAPRAFGRMHVARHLGKLLAEHPNLSINLVLDDELVDIVGEGFDVALRIAELPDSSLVARKLVPIHHWLVAAPSYLDAHGRPTTVEELDGHACVPSDIRDPWKLTDGGDEIFTHRPQGSLQTNSTEVVREAILSGTGIGLRPSWEIGEDLRDKRLERVLPDYCGAEEIGLHAVYPSRRFLPTKVRAFIDFIAELYTPPYWEQIETPVRTTAPQFENSPVTQHQPEAVRNPAE